MAPDGSIEVSFTGEGELPDETAAEKANYMRNLEEFYHPTRPAAAKELERLDSLDQLRKLTTPPSPIDAPAED